MLQKNRVKIFLLLAAYFCVALMTTYPVLAQSYGSKPRLEKIKLTQRDTDKGALYKGLDLYTRYWKQYGSTIDDFVNFKIPAYADYVRLKSGATEKRFIILYRKTYDGGTCAPMGCEISIFENYEKNKWRYVLFVTSHEIFISNKENDGYYDIYIKPSSQNIAITDEKKRVMHRYVWNGAKYTDDF